MARKSAAALSVLSVGSRRPDAPPGLTPAEADVWRGIVSTKPGDWFARDTHPLLAAYCRAAVAAEVLSQQVAAFDPAWLATDDGLRRYDRLLAMQYRQGGLLASLATKMRLAQQSSYDDKTARTRSQSTYDAEKPWQRNANAG